MEILLKTRAHAHWQSREQVHIHQGREYWSWGLIPALLDLTSPYACPTTMTEEVPTQELSDCYGLGFLSPQCFLIKQLKGFNIISMTQKKKKVKITK